MRTDHVLDGQVWLSIVRAAQVIGTTTTAVRRLMGADGLEWRPLRPGSTTFLVRKADVVRIALEHRANARARQRAAKPRRPRIPKPVPHPIEPTAPPITIDPFGNRPAAQLTLPMESGRDGTGWAGGGRSG